MASSNIYLFSSKQDNEVLQISQNMLPNYCSNIANEYGIKTCGVNKLVLNLGNKSIYVLHYRSYIY